MTFPEMGSSSKALQSSWVKRLRPREIEGTWAGSPKSPRASVCPCESEEEGESKSSSVSRCVIQPHLFPKAENVFDEPAKRLRFSPSTSGDSRDLVTETHVIASFGPFQVRSRSLVPVREKEKKQQAEMGRAAALVPADQRKQYSRGREKEVVTEQTPSATAWSRRIIKSCSEDSQEFRGGLLGSEIACTYWSNNKATTNDYRNKHPNTNPNPNLTLGPDSDQLRSNKQKLSQTQWQWPEEKMLDNPGFCKEIVPSTGKHVVSDNHRMDRILCERRPETQTPFVNAFRWSSANVTTDSSEFEQYATLSDLPSHFAVLKQTQVLENCSNHCLIDQQTIWKPEAFQNVKANHLEPGSSKGHCHGPTRMLGSHGYGIGQRFGSPNSMEKYPFHSPNYPCLGHQKDEIIFPESSSTASLPRDVHADLLNRTDNRKKSIEPHIHLRSGTSCRENDAAYYRPTRERVYLEPESNSSHHSNCPGLDQEYNSMRPDNGEPGSSKQFNKVRDGWSGVKSEGSNFENQSTEQRHVIGGDTGYAFQYKSMHQNYQENSTVGISRRSDLHGVFPYLAPEVQPLAFRFSSKEEEIVSGRDDDEKGCLTKDKKISTMIQCVLPGKDSPRGNISLCAGKAILDTPEIHQFKSRKQSAEEGPSFQRLHNDREAELNCSRHVKLKISAADRQTSSSGKKTHCTHEELGPTDAGIANNLAAISEANTIKSCRPQMWLQRWIHSSGKMDIVNDQVLAENWNCNPVKSHGSLEWSGDNRKTDFVQWTKSRRENDSYFSGSRSQAFGEGHFKSDLKVMKKILTSSASAMAIVGTRTKEMYVAQPHRKDIFPVWTSTQRADADAKVIGLEKEIETPDELELNPKKTAFEKEIVEHEDIRV